ncbi:unnamed protein product [Lactuca virosa]|uniref:non-specific serine/threonine protein kinase n=1 Tax=Lactuca virosa TaxID=75947 RepID=A0AAU9NKS1_9ASTR|nr:unnamed protein product [Lactuca virosa]
MKGNHYSCLIFLQLLHIISAEMDTIGGNEYIRDGETIISSGEMFELGFFSPGNSKNRYLGIWYYKISQTVVWVANREIPLNNTSGVFKVSSQGSLLLLNGEGRDIWSSNSSVLVGNLHPVAQLLDNGNLVVRNESDIDHLNLIWQSFDHPCDHILPGMKFGKDLVSGRDIALSSWKSLDDPSPVVLRVLNHYTPEEWNIANWSSGCQREKPLDCMNRDGFQKITGVTLPDSRKTWYNVSMSLAECKRECKRNCSCTAYANLDVRNGGSGCLLWFGNLMDIRDFEENQDLYIRIAMTESTGWSKKRKIILVLLTSVGVVLVGLTLAVLYAYKKKNSPRPGNLVQSLVDDYTDGSQNKDVELLSFSLAKIAKYTNHFSVSNKLGEGGFGPVYKGVMEDGREIAVKRLSETSTQGFDEFENEVRFVARLQHRNLVKLFGYCAQGNEIMLIYEYMPNRSLDTFLFDETRHLMLDWPLRFHIIQGISRGLLYLHQDSRLRIIHRDLKASNILLDNDMNPKISDFGLARRFKGYETGAKTKNVVGTYGYISPEYAVHGFFSIKSDVFSFGVLVLEIVSGMKNRGFSHHEHCDNLLGHAWRLYKDDKTLELVSESLRKSCIVSEVLRCVHIGLLCVQNHVEDRPTMSFVVLMFGNEGMLPPPKQPAFFSELEPNSTSSKPGSVSVNEVTITSLDAR